MKSKSKMDSKKVLIIIPYFGNLPNYFSLWLKSVKFNPNFNWLLLTDDDQKFDFPKNIKIDYLTFDELKKRISLIFDFEISLSSTYKLCDFRPAYGHIFSNEIMGYDFWGYGDLDLIYGNLEYFITDELLHSYDRLLNNGHLSLFRNNERMKYAYQLKVEGFPYYKEVFTSPLTYCFDEGPGVTSMFIKIGLKQYLNNFMADIAFNSFKILHGKKGTENFKNQFFVWDNKEILQLYEKEGKVYSKRFAYIHFQKRKMNLKYSLDDYKKATRIVFLSNYFEIIKENGSYDFKDFKRRTRIDYLFQFYYFALKRKYNKSLLKYLKLF